MTIRGMITATGMLLSVADIGICYSVGMSPERLGALSFAWFGFPYIWALTVVWMLVSMAARRREVMLACILALIATWPSMRRLVSPIGTGDLTGLRETGSGGDEIKVMTYNIHFAAKTDEKMAAFIERESPDVLCLQEICGREWKENRGEEKLSAVINSYRYKIYTKSHGGIMILSRLPMQELKDSLHTRLANALVAELTIDSTKKLTVIGCHLNSIMLTNGEVGSVMDSRLAHDRLTMLRSTYEKTLQASYVRAVEARIMAEMIKATSGPVVICGDFNDTPASYTYHTIRTSRDLRDTFCGSGAGVGRTYLGDLPPLKIDHILTTQDIKTKRFEQYDVEYSDHRPVAATLRL